MDDTSEPRHRDWAAELGVTEFVESQESVSRSSATGENANERDNTTDADNDTENEDLRFSMQSEQLRKPGRNHANSQTDSQADDEATMVKSVHGSDNEEDLDIRRLAQDEDREDDETEVEEEGEAMDQGDDYAKSDNRSEDQASADNQEDEDDGAKGDDEGGQRALDEDVDDEVPEDGDASDKRNDRMNFTMEADDEDGIASAFSQVPRRAQDLQGPLLKDNPFAQAAQIDTEHLLKYIYDIEVAADRAAMREIGFDEFMTTGHEIIASMFTKVLTELMGGNLPQAIECDPDLKASMLTLKNRSGSGHPGIYVRFLVSRRGLSPTPNELRMGIQDLKAYARIYNCTMSDDEVKKIETQIGAGEYNGFGSRHLGARRYLSKDIPKKKYEFSEERIKAVVIFISALEAMLDAIPADEQDKPLRSPLKYVGYAMNCKDRNTHNHDKHSGSNFLMSLFEAIMMARFQQRYKMRWWVVALAMSKDAVHGSEMIITALTQGYIETGTGFAHHSAGESVASHKRVIRKDGREQGVDTAVWIHLHNWIRENTPYLVNTQIQTEIFEKRSEELASLRSDIAAFDNQIKENEQEITKIRTAEHAQLQYQIADFEWHTEHCDLLAGRYRDLADR
jgi:hypothetical protein